MTKQTRTDPSSPATGGSPNRRWYRRHPRIALSLFLLIGTIVIDFTAGSVLYAAGVTLPAMTENAAYRARHPVYHHGMRPNTAHEGTWGENRYNIYIDSLALKNGKVRDVPLESDAKRVLLMGDSFTEGIGVEYQDTFAGILAERFADDRVEFFNAGVSSYSPIIYLRKTQHLIDTVGLHIDHVCVGIDMSDIFDETGYSFDAARNVTHKHDASVSSTVKRFLAEHTVIIGSIRVWLRSMKHANKSEAELQGLDNHRCLWANDETEWKKYGERGLALAIEHMNELHDYLKSKGIGLNIMIYPWPDQVMRKDLESKQVKAWTEWASQRGVELINLFPDFIGAIPPEESLQRYFIPGDVHWNKAGHALVANRLEAYLRKK